MSTKATIVIIEDEKNICSFISRILEPEGYRVITSNTGRDGLQHINSNDSVTLPGDSSKQTLLTYLIDCWIKI